MRRAMLAVMGVVVLVATVGLVEPQRAQAGWPGYFSFSVGSPYGYGYPGYAGYPYGVAPGPQSYFSAGIPLGGFGFGGNPYRAYYGGYGRPGYGHCGYGHGHYRW